MALWQGAEARDTGHPSFLARRRVERPRTSACPGLPGRAREMLRMGRQSSTRHGLPPTERRHGARGGLVKLGDRFGRLIVLAGAGHNRYRNRRWLCQCDCGSPARAVFQFSLRDGSTTSCGCFGKEQRLPAITTHGQSRSRTYASWSSIVQRCTNPNDQNYRLYGGAGIRICKRWRKFEPFFLDMGECPSGHTIERIDGKRGYEPGNCRWATHKEQSRNRRTNIWVIIRGERLILTDAAARIGVAPGTIGNRMRRLGETHQEAFDFYIRKRME